MNALKENEFTSVYDNIRSEMNVAGAYIEYEREDNITIAIIEDRVINRMTQEQLDSLNAIP